MIGSPTQEPLWKRSRVHIDHGHHLRFRNRSSGGHRRLCRYDNRGDAAFHRTIFTTIDRQDFPRVSSHEDSEKGIFGCRLLNSSKLVIYPLSRAC